MRPVRKHSNHILRLGTLAGCVGLFLASCSTWNKPKEEPKPLPAAIALNVGDIHHFEFPADGAWHPSPIVVSEGDKLTMLPVGVSSDLPIGAVKFNLNRMTQLVRPETPLLVTNPGRLYFSLAQRYATADRTQIEVEIARVK